MTHDALRHSPVLGPGWTPWRMNPRGPVCERQHMWVPTQYRFRPVSEDGTMWDLRECVGCGLVERRPHINPPYEETSP